jgi:hypothetical protein
MPPLAPMLVSFEGTSHLTLSRPQTLLNPFHELNAPIRNQTFDARIKASAKKHL